MFGNNPVQDARRLEMASRPKIDHDVMEAIDLIKRYDSTRELASLVRELRRANTLEKYKTASDDMRVKFYYTLIERFYELGNVSAGYELLNTQNDPFETKIAWQALAVFFDEVLTIRFVTNGANALKLDLTRASQEFLNVAASYGLISTASVGQHKNGCDFVCNEWATHPDDRIRAAATEALIVQFRANAAAVTPQMIQTASKLMGDKNPDISKSAAWCISRLDFRSLKGCIDQWIADNSIGVGVLEKFAGTKIESYASRLALTNLGVQLNNSRALKKVGTLLSPKDKIKARDQICQFLGTVENAATVLVACEAFGIEEEMKELAKQKLVDDYTSKALRYKWVEVLHPLCEKSRKPRIASENPRFARQTRNGF